MRKERVLQVLLALIGLFFVAGIYPRIIKGRPFEVGLSVSQNSTERKHPYGH